jgi:uncharacterized protein
VAQAPVVRDVVDALVADDPGTRVLMLDDLNEFAFSPPVVLLRATATTDADLDMLIEQFAPQSGTATSSKGSPTPSTQMLVSQALAGILVPGSYDVVHLNAEFADQASDHGPQVARFLLPP